MSKPYDSNATPLNTERDKLHFPVRLSLLWVPLNTERDKLPSSQPPPAPARIKETGGPKGMEPTRYGDWENHGRCFDF